VSLIVFASPATRYPVDRRSPAAADEISDQNPEPGLARVLPILQPCPGGRNIDEANVSTALTRILDVVVDVAACAAAGYLLDDGAGVGGQLCSVVQDAELAVFYDDGDDFPAVGVAEVDLYPGDHHAALAGNHAGHCQGLGGSRSGRSRCCPSEAVSAVKRLAGVAMPSDWCGRSQL
jgi:hypothetical protein